MRIFSFYEIAACIALATLGAAAQQPSRSDNPASSRIDDLAYAQKLLKDGYHDLAITQFRQFLSKYPDATQAPEAWRAIGAAQLALQDFHAAKETFGLFEARYPNDQQIDEVRWQLAETFVLLHEPRAAASTFERLVYFNPSGALAPAAQHRAAALWIASGDYRRGRELLYKLMEDHPASELRLPAHLLLVESLQREGDIRRALQEADRLLRSFPASDLTAQAYFVRARLLEQVAGAAQLAEEAYTKLTQVFPDGEWTVRAQARLAELAYHRGDLGQAVQLLHKASSRSPAGAERNSMILRLAAMHMESGDHTQALAVLKDFAPTLADSLQLLQYAFAQGVAFEKSNDFQNAVKAYEMAMSSSASVEKALPPDAFAWRWPRQRSFLRGAACELAMRHPNRALAFCAAYRREYPAGELRDAALFQEAAVRRQAYQDESFAARLYQQIIEDIPASVLVDDAQFELAAAYERMGEHRRAIREYDRLLERYPASELCRDAERRRRLLIEFAPAADDTHLAALARLLSNISSPTFSGSVPLELGKLALQRGALEEAVRYFRESLAQKQDEQTAHAALFHLGKAYALMVERAALLQEEDAQAWRDSAEIALAAVLAAKNSATTLADEAGVLSARLRFPRRDMLASEAALLRADSVLARHPTNPDLDFLRLWTAQARMAVAKSDSMQAARLVLTLQKLAVEPSRWRNEALYSLAQWRWHSSYTSAALQTCSMLEGATQNDVFKAQGRLLRADILAALKRYAEAADVLQRCEQEFFYSALADSARQRRVGYLMRANRFREALEVMESSQPHHTDDQGSDGMALQRARAYEATANYSLAIRAYLRFLRERPEAAEAGAALLAAAQLTGKVGAKQLARHYAQECIQRFPKSPEATAAKNLLADLRFENEEYDQARELYQEVARTDRNREVQRLAAKQAIMCAYKTGVVAESEVKTFQQQFPGDKVALGEFQYAAGEQALASRDFENADRHFAKLRKGFRDTPAAALGDYGLGRSLLLQNRAKEALEVLTDIPRRYPKHPFLPTVFLGLGDFYQSQQQWDNATASFNRVIQDSSFDSNYRLAVRSLINCYDRMGLWDRALGLLRGYLERFPDDPQAFDMRLQIGIFLMNLLQYDDAVAHLRRLKPFADAQTEPEIQYYIGKSYMNAGRFELAIAEFLRVKYFSKPTKLPWDVTALYEAGVCFTRLRNFEKARRLFQQIVREQGAESHFGRFARERINELDQLRSQSEGPEG